MCIRSDNAKSEPPAETPQGATCATCTQPPVRVWAAGRGVPGRYEGPDARLPNPQSGDKRFGQDGWDMCFEFSNAADLKSKIGGGVTVPEYVDPKQRPFGENQISKLAIHAHGGSGAVDIDNTQGTDLYSAKFTTDGSVLNTPTLPRYKQYFEDLERVLAPGAMLYFMCCLTGYGVAGNTFLIEVSKLLAKKRIAVVGYTSVLYVHTFMQRREDDHGQTYPGCRETDENGPNGSSVKALEGGKWDNFADWPWAYYNTKRATVASQGRITKQGDFAGAAPQPSSFDGKVHPEFQ